jgi:hypothetical protein
MTSESFAIETRYAGCRFRSRLEARWAVFFDHLGVRWEYEPEGFHLSDGGFYLPDFRLLLPRDGGEGVLWAEVKPEGVPVPAFERFIADSPNSRGAILRSIPDPNRLGDFETEGEVLSQFYDDIEANKSVAGWDNHHCFCICPSCGVIGYEFEGRVDRVGHCRADCKHGALDHPRLLEAYTAARSARFERGETPRTRH